jgi:hypothetical protein
VVALALYGITSFENCPILNSLNTIVGQSAAALAGVISEVHEDQLDQISVQTGMNCAQLSQSATVMTPFFGS